MSIIETKLSGDLRYAWYSEKQKLFTGYVTYRRAGSGFPVNITCLSLTQDHGCNWDDMRFVGIIEGNPIAYHKDSRHPVMRVIDDLIDNIREEEDE